MNSGISSELRKKIREENKYYLLLIGNPRYKPQGGCPKRNKRIVGIIEGDPKKYKRELHHLNFQYFDSWKEAYIQLPKLEEIR